MRPCIFLLLALSALLCSVAARQVAFVRARLPNQLQASQLLSAAASASRPNNVAKCYGLARKTRTRSLQVPVLYNSVSGQTAAVPDYLFSLNDKTIDKMEAEGWEVRMKPIMMPDTFYQRVPVCCPWDTACYHNQQRDQQMPSPLAASGTGACKNGGVLVPKGNAQVCVCPRGFQGVWCQIPSMMASAFPAGPVIPYRKVVPSTADMLKQAVKQAQLWKQKMMSSRQPPVIFNGGQKGRRPLLSPNDHIITSINRQWAQQNPSEKAMRIKMAMMMNLYLKQQQAERKKNMPKARLPAVMMTAPIYTKVKDLRMNPYSTGPAQPFINPQMVSMMNHLQGRQGMPTQLNSFGQSLLPVQSYARGDMARNKGMSIPQARTPWDMDPWDSQRGTGRGQPTMGRPSMAFGRGQTMMGGPSMKAGRDKLMALAFAQYIQNIQNIQRRQAMKAQANGVGGTMAPNGTPQINRRIPIREPPMIVDDPDYFNTDNELPPFQGNNQPAAGTTDMPRHIADGDMTSVELPRPGLGRGDADHQFSNQGNGPMAGQGMGAGRITSQQTPLRDMNGLSMPQGMNPMDGQMVQGMPVGEGGVPAMPKMPSQEELQRMTECRVVLEPRITMCLNDAGHALTLEQFMDPRYMETARGVCADSETVGQCVMRQDQACGEGPTVEMTRKMIDSVLQMMGMVCGQISKLDQQRGVPQGAVPGLTPQQGPQSDTNAPHLTTVPHGINIHQHTDSPVGEAPTPSTLPTHFVHGQSSRDSEAPSKSSDKFTTSKIGAAVTSKTPPKAANKGHQSKEAVTSDSFIPGAPLWIVILVACVVLLISCLSLVLIVLLMRRRRVEKIKEIERKAQPLDPKLYAIGIPPPQYATTSIKTQDELNLPPLDLAEETDDSTGSVSGKELSEAEEEEDDVKKPAVSDDDADDESDEKDEEADKKKKEKKDKK